MSDGSYGGGGGGYCDGVPRDDVEGFVNLYVDGRFSHRMPYQDIEGPTITRIERPARRWAFWRRSNT